jgi:hypothetical protein
MWRSPSSTDFDRGILRAVTWLLGASVTAVVSHAMVEACDRSGAMGNDVYGERAHVALGPIVAAIVVVVCTLVARAVSLRLGRVHRIDPIVAFGRGIGTSRSFSSSVTVGLGGLCLLVAMEICEQFAAVGHFEGLADALGGNAPISIAIVLLVAAFVVFVGLRFTRIALSAGMAVAEAFVAWVSLESPLLAASASRTRPVRHLRHASAPAFLARCSGLRAPPTSL